VDAVGEYRSLALGFPARAVPGRSRGGTWQRCLPEQKARPLLQSEEAFHELYAARRKAYAEGTLRVETQGRSIDEVASQIQLLLGLAGTNATT